MKKYLSLLLFAALLAGFSCSDDAPEEIGFPIKFQLYVMDKAGQRSSTLKQGEDMQFGFSLTNTTNETVTLLNFNAELVCNRDTTFFRVMTRPLKNEKPVKIGTACRPENCQVPAYNVIPANGVQRIEFPWRGDCAVGLLPVGTYSTSFTYKFQVVGGPYNEIARVETFVANFTVIE